jgi:hypothetical protein
MYEGAINKYCINEVIMCQGSNYQIKIISQIKSNNFNAIAYENE